MTADFQTIEGHVVILGWSPRVSRIISELRSKEHEVSRDLRPILVVAEDIDDKLQLPYEKVYFVYGSINSPKVLERANLSAAHSVLIPTVFKGASASDGETVFALLAALTVNPGLRICIEVADANNCDTLGRIREKQLSSSDIEIVSFESVAERLMAQATISPGITEVYNHLLSYTEDTNEIYVAPIGREWVGKTYRQTAMACFEHRVILIGYQDQAVLGINPENRDYVFKNGDQAWFIAMNKGEGLKVLNPGLLG